MAAWLAECTPEPGLTKEDMEEISEMIQSWSTLGGDQEVLMAKAMSTDILEYTCYYDKVKQLPSGTQLEFHFVKRELRRPDV